MDSISLQSISLSTRIGVPESERAEEQKVSVNITLHTDCSVVAKTDDISRGIDYFAVYQDVLELAKKERKTIERFASDIADHILKNYKPESVEITVKKFVLPQTEAVSVTILRP